MSQDKPVERAAPGDLHPAAPSVQQWWRKVGERLLHPNYSGPRQNYSAEGSVDDSDWSGGKKEMGGESLS